MGSELSFCVRSWAAWTPRRETEAAWRAWAGSKERGGAPAAIPVVPLPAGLRRRISPLGQAALRCAWGLPDAARSRIVLVSRHGEFARTLSILDALVRREEVSPADFTISVHLALAGLLSIAQGNRRGHTAIAAGPDSFGFGLMEALACLADRRHEPVLLIYYDEPLPAPYDTLDDAPQEPIAVALGLTADTPGERVGFAVAPPSGGAPPSSTALDFLRFLLSGTPAALSGGERYAWRWSRDAALD